MSQQEQAIAHRPVLLAGASGLVGGHLLELLLERTEVPVISLGRRWLDRESPKLDQRVVDFENLEEVGLPPLDAVFCCLGTTLQKAGSPKAFRRVDRHYVRSVAHRGRSAGARTLVVVSSVGASHRASHLYLKTKGKMERDLSKLGYEALHIFRPSLLVGNRDEARPWERLGIGVALALDPLIAVLPGVNRLRAIPAPLVAAGMLGAWRSGKTGRRRYAYADIRRLAREFHLSAE